jgi:ectoine hydroxylase-related dioxygenase (phytanoyl-CoA dioxygenase family)
MDFPIAELRARYESDGAVMVPQLISRAWAERLLGIVDDVLKQARDPAAEFEDVQGIEIRRAAKGGRITIRWMWRHRPDVRRFFDETRAPEVLAGILGSQRLRLYFDLTFIHEPMADDPAGSPWHNDISAFPFVGEQVPSLWISLVDIEPDMSPLRCLRGSHKDRALYRPPVYTRADLSLPDGFVDPPDFEALVAAGRYEVLTWDRLSAGDALIINPYTVHGAPGNQSKARRRVAFTSRLLGDDIRWRPTPFSMPTPGIDYASLKVDTVPDGALTPVVWPRAASA